MRLARFKVVDPYHGQRGFLGLPITVTADGRPVGFNCLLRDRGERIYSVQDGRWRFSFGGVPRCLSSCRCPTCIIPSPPKSCPSSLLRGIGGLALPEGADRDGLGPDHERIRLSMRSFLLPAQGAWQRNPRI